MNIGIVTLAFPNRTNEEAAQIIADNGFGYVQLFFCQIDSKYWRYNDRADVSHIRGDESQRIIKPYRQRSREHVPDLPVIIEYVTEENFLQAKEHLLKY